MDSRIPSANFTDAPSRVSWMAASPPGMGIAMTTTPKLCRGLWKLHNTSPGLICHLYRTSTLGDAGENHRLFSGTRATLARSCSLCYRQADGIGTNHQAQEQLLSEHHKSFELLTLGSCPPPVTHTHTPHTHTISTTTTAHCTT
jgi:hypothetical protein